MVCVIEGSGFPASYRRLHRARPFSVAWTRADIARSLLTVGYGSRNAAIANVGRWRAHLLLNMVRGYLDPALVPTPYFWNLEQSERVVVSFLFGQAFTHRFAQHQMGIPHLLHAQGLWTRAGRSARPKTGASPSRPRSRPDFIGFEGAEVHVLESQGRSGRKQTAKEEADALGQVSVVGRVGRIAPTTRVACFSCFGLGGSRVFAIDPPADSIDLLNLSYDEWFILRRAHQFFLEDHKEEFELWTEERVRFIGAPLGQFVYAIDKEVLGFLLSGDAQGERATVSLQKVLAEKQELYDRLNTETRSVGPDGVMVIDRTHGE